DVRLKIPVVVQPIVRQLLRAKDEHGFVPQLVVLYHGERSECLSQTYAVSEDASIEGFELVNYARGSIALKVEELLPNLTFLVAGSVIGQHVFIEVFEELIEDVVKHQEIDAAGRVFLVYRGDMFGQGVRDIDKFLLVLP